jgi:hypothetical protein
MISLTSLQMSLDVNHTIDSKRMKIKNIRNILQLMLML